MIKIFIVDDHRILLKSLKDFLEDQKNMTCCGVASSGSEAIEKINALEIDVVLMDIGLPDMSGLECTKLLIKKHPNLKIIGLSTYMEISIVKKLMRVGAKGFISKANEMDELVDGILMVSKGETYISKSIQNNFLNDLSNKNPTNTKYSYKPQITKRELEVLHLIAQEYTTSEISEQLFISANTVESHRKNLINKFQVRNSVGLIKNAIELQYISL